MNDIKVLTQLNKELLEESLIHREQIAKLEEEVRRLSMTQEKM